MQLCCSHCCLHIRYFEVESQVGIGVLVVIAVWQVTQLPIEALLAGVFHAGFAVAIASPVADRLHDSIEF